jgi:hypothetical protein
MVLPHDLGDFGTVLRLEPVGGVVPLGPPCCYGTARRRGRPTQGVCGGSASRPEAHGAGPPGYLTGVLATDRNSTGPSRPDSCSGESFPHSRQVVKV